MKTRQMEVKVKHLGKRLQFGDYFFEIPKKCTCLNNLRQPKCSLASFRVCRVKSYQFY